MEPWQNKQIQALDPILQNDWTYIDVGASLGEMLQYFVQKMGFGFAFEPNPTNYRHLLNQFYHVQHLRVIEKVVSDQNNLVKFWNNGSHMGNILGHDMDYRAYSDNYIMVPSITLDSFLIDKTIDFIKIDIEGAEWKLFDGAKETLKKHNIVYQIEFHLDEDWHNRQIIYDNGYEIYTLDYKKLHHTDPRPYQAILIHKNDKRFKHIMER